MRERLHTIYQGRVQGVGFRYTAEDIALSLKITGWVRNLPDGTVEVLAEGPKTALLKFLESIRQSSMGRHIVKEKIDWDKDRHEFTDFRIEFAY